MIRQWRMPTLAALVLTLVLLAVNAAFGAQAQTQLPADGVTSIEQTAPGEWTVTFDAAPWEFKAIDNPQLIVCGTNYGRPCSTSESFTWAHGDCITTQVDWSGQHNSSDPYVCRPIVTASPTATAPVPTLTASPSPTATLPTPTQTPTEAPSSWPTPAPTNSASESSTTSLPASSPQPSPRPKPSSVKRVGPAPTLTPTVTPAVAGPTELAATGTTWTTGQLLIAGFLALGLILSTVAALILLHQNEQLRAAAPQYKRGTK